MTPAPTRVSHAPPVPPRLPPATPAPATPTPTAHRRNSPIAVPSPTASPSPPPSSPRSTKAVSYEALIWMYPRPPPVGSKKSKRQGAKKKAGIPAYTTYGPQALSTTMDRSSFLESIATRIDYETDSLDVDSFMYRFEIPANSTWKPVRDSNGYESLCAAIRTKKKQFNIILTMNAAANMSSRARAGHISEVDDSDDEEPSAKRTKVHISTFSCYSLPKPNNTDSFR